MIHLDVSSTRKKVFNSHYYELFDGFCNQIPTPYNYSFAKNFCESRGGYLVVISSQEEAEFLKNNFFYQGFITGAYQDPDDMSDNNGIPEGGRDEPFSDWKWLDNETSSWFKWWPGHPHGLRESAAVMETNGKWKTSNVGLHQSRDFVCEYSSDPGEFNTSEENATFVQGYYGKGILFNGIDDQVVIKNVENSTLDFANNITVTVAVKPLDEQFEGMIISRYNDWFIIWNGGENDNGKIAFQCSVFEEGYGWHRAITEENFSIRKWYLVTLRFGKNESFVECFINGVKYASINGSSSSNYNYITIGGFYPNSYGHYSTHAIIDEVIIYNRSLSENEIKRTNLLTLLVHNPSQVTIPDLQIGVKINNTYTAKEEFYTNSTNIDLAPGEIKTLNIRIPEGEIEKIFISSPCGASAEYEP